MMPACRSSPHSVVEFGVTQHTRFTSHRVRTACGERSHRTSDAMLVTGILREFSLCDGLSPQPSQRERCSRGRVRTGREHTADAATFAKLIRPQCRRIYLAGMPTLRPTPSGRGSVACAFSTASMFSRMSGGKGAVLRMAMSIWIVMFSEVADSQPSVA